MFSSSQSHCIAAQIARHCEGAQAITFEGGYAVRSDLPAGRICFEAARTIEKKHNEAGRTTRYVGEYSDGSRLRFSWSENRGAMIRVEV